MLMMQLARWGAQLELDEALAMVLSDDYDAESATYQDRPVRLILTFGETVGTLTKNGLLDVHLVLDWLWVAGLWARVAPAAHKQREKFGEPRLYENFEELAKVT
jgi:hypothetical protein